MGQTFNVGTSPVSIAAEGRRTALVVSNRGQQSAAFKIGDAGGTLRAIAFATMTVTTVVTLPVSAAGPLGLRRFGGVVGDDRQPGGQRIDIAENVGGG